MEVWKSNIDKPIEMTIGIPVNNLVWFALESLRNQSEVNFGWELIIYGNISLNEEYYEKFPGCQRIVINKISKSIAPLVVWKNIEKLSSNTSKILVMQLSEEYSSPNRLRIHYEHFKNKNCLISTQIMGMYYSIKNLEKYFYYGINKENKTSKFFTQEHMYMAILKRDIRRMGRINGKINVNLYIKNNIAKLNAINYNTGRYIYTDYDLDKENWKRSFYVSRNEIYPGGVYLPYNRNTILKYESMETYIPKYVIERVLSIKMDVSKNFLIK